MNHFSDLDKDIRDENARGALTSYIQLLEEARISKEEGKIEARLNRAEAYDFAGKTFDRQLLASRAAEYFNRSTINISQLLTMMVNTGIGDELQTSTIQFFFENLYDFGFLLDFLVSNVIGFVAESFVGLSDKGVEYSASVAKMSLQAVIGAIFAVSYEAFSPECDIIENIMRRSDEDMTVYDIMEMVKKDYLLIVPKDAISNLDDFSPKQQSRTKKHKHSRKHHKDRR